MRVELNHTIVWCRDKQQSTRFLRDILDLPEPIPFGQMLVVPLSNGVSLDFFDSDAPIAAQHYAFLISDAEFDRAFARIQEKGLAYWADPAKKRLGETYAHNGGHTPPNQLPGSTSARIASSPSALKIDSLSTPLATPKNALVPASTGSP